MDPISELFLLSDSLQAEGSAHTGMLPLFSVIFFTTEFQSVGLD